MLIILSGKPCVHFASDMTQKDFDLRNCEVPRVITFRALSVEFMYLWESMNDKSKMHLFGKGFLTFLPLIVLFCVR